MAAPHHDRKSPYVPRGSALAVWRCRDREILNDGPARTGKSRGNMEKLLAAAIKYPGSRQFMARATRESMTKSVVYDFETEVLPRELVPEGSMDGRSRYWFPNGSVIDLIGLNRVSSIMSSEYDRGVVFEANELEASQYEYLSTRLSGKVDGMYPQIVADTNPGAPTHWLWQRYKAGLMTRINSTHKDNPRWWSEERQEWTEDGIRLIKGLESLTGSRKARLLHGLWVGEEGMIFPEWSSLRHVVSRRSLLERRDLRYKDLAVVRAVDLGFRDPFVCLWLRVDELGRIYVDREYVRTGLNNRKHAAAIKALTEDESMVHFTVCDHDAEAQDTLGEHGIDCINADKPKAKSSGRTWTSHLDAIRARLSEDWCKEGPGLFYVDSALKDGGGPDPAMTTATPPKPCGLEEEIVQYVWATPTPSNPNPEQPHDEHNHSMDALRYGVIACGKWVDGKLEAPKPKYPVGSIGDFVGLNDDPPTRPRRPR